MRFWKSEGVITLVATLLGVFLALYLNNWNESRKEKNQKEIATEKILMEISANKEKLKESLSNYKLMLATYQFFNTCLTPDGAFVTSAEYMSEFKTKYPGVLYTNDSVKVDDEKYRYTNMDLGLEFTLEQVELRTIAWETLKNSDVNSLFSFNCLMSLEYIYESINSTVQINTEIYNTAKLFAQGDASVLNELIFNLRVAIDSEEKIIEICDEELPKLKDCVNS